MFDDWKNAWRQAVENFQREVHGGDDHAPPRVRAMERELVSAAGALGKLDDEIRRTRRSLDAEREALEACRRRGELARNAGDDETVRIAGEFAVRHEERAAVLTRKLAVLEDERSLLDRDIGEMRQLVTEAGQAQTADSGIGTGGNAGGASTFDDEAAARDRDFSRLEQDARERAAAERLEELKRRMQG
ncbi:MAG TPA: hypothetical protein VK929_01045 [Longimicrobiales bacterium]|nr:hypothetical protein [Longimicrobiales bacterium]